MLSYPINYFVILKIIFYNFVITQINLLFYFMDIQNIIIFITYICYKMFYYFILYILKIKMNCNYFGILVGRLCVCSQYLCLLSIVINLSSFRTIKGFTSLLTSQSHKIS